jgi:hypothetical protein
MDLYRANSCMVAELRDELVGTLPPDPGRPDFVSLGCVSRLNRARGGQGRHPRDFMVCCGSR